MELLKLLLLCSIACWTDGGGMFVTPEGAFSAEAARLLRDIRMPATRANHVPAVLADLEDILQPRFPGCEAALFGSVATGLAIAESDVDVSVTFPHWTNVTSPELVLETGDIMLEHPDMFQVIETIPGARTPIVRAIHLPTGFRLDVSFNSFNGVMNSKLVRYFMMLDRRVKDLAQILKHWARLNRVTGPSELPSYGIVTMAIFFLQQKKILPTVASLQNNSRFIIDDWNMGFAEDMYETRNNDSLCEILGDFFKYFKEFDYENYIASPFVGRPVKITLFKDLKTIPGDFDVYKRNVGSNIKQPLRLKLPIFQDNFVHNNNLAYRIDVAPESIFMNSIEYAAEKYQQGCVGFLQAILPP